MEHVHTPPQGDSRITGTGVDASVTSDIITETNAQHDSVPARAGDTPAAGKNPSPQKLRQKERALAALGMPAWDEAAIGELLRSTDLDFSMVGWYYEQLEDAANLAPTADKQLSQLVGRLVEWDHQGMARVGVVVGVKCKWQLCVVALDPCAVLAERPHARQHPQFGGLPQRKIATAQISHMFT